MKTLGKHRCGMERREREKIKTENDCYYSFWNKLRVLSRFRSSVWPCVRYAFKNELNIFPCSPSFLCADIFYSTTNGCFSFSSQCCNFVYAIDTFLTILSVVEFWTYNNVYRHCQKNENTKFT